ncbi:hypothetical protein [Tsukamurella sp. 1534]|uniref:hypothetical protein n=1 Tax=Tsukamurella sp. 1534 TaxID=1151061 RepID=UPI0002E050D6|nr:hypothetical protein [Tsukamurella sp. 1534]
MGGDAGGAGRTGGGTAHLSRWAAGIACAVVLLVVCALVGFGPAMYGAVSVDSSPNRVAVVLAAVFASLHLLLAVAVSGWGALAAVRRIHWCVHRRRAVRRWSVIARSGGFDWSRTALALFAGTNDPTKRSIRRLWRARVPRWQRSLPFLGGAGATLGLWAVTGARLSDPPVMQAYVLFAAALVYGGTRAPSVFESSAVGRHARGRRRAAPG